MKNRLSKCCEAPIEFKGSPGFEEVYVCSKCGEYCDLKEDTTSDEQIVEAHRSDVMRLLEKIARHKLGGRHNTAEELMDSLLDIGYSIVEETDSNVVKLQTRMKPSEPAPGDPEEIAADNKNMAYSIAAKILKDLRTLRLSIEADVPKISQDEKNEQYRAILKLDRKLEGLENSGAFAPRTPQKS